MIGIEPVMSIIANSTIKALNISFMLNSKLITLYFFNYLLAKIKLSS